jgi:hypothetical protein
MRKPNPEAHGFGEPRSDRNTGRLNSAIANLIATITLAAGTLVAATAVSIGIARADSLGAVMRTESGVFVFALVLAGLFVAASLTKAVSPRRNARREALRARVPHDRPPER